MRAVHDRSTVRGQSIPAAPAGGRRRPMSRSRGQLAFVVALSLGLGACATSGDIDRLNAKIDDLSKRMDERTAAAEQRAAAAEQKADMAASQAQAAAGQADAAARKSEAIFNKSVSKGGR
jgi:hypothetical protein